jgi:hypothetical protein
MFPLCDLQGCVDLISPARYFASRISDLGWFLFVFIGIFLFSMLQNPSQGRPRVYPRGQRLGFGAPLVEAHPGEVLPSPSACIKAPRTTWLMHSLSRPLFPLTWLPRLELCQWVEGNLSCRTPSCCPISSLNPPSSAALLDQSPNDIYTPYMCNSLEVPLLWHYVIVPVLLHWCRGAMAL